MSQKRIAFLLKFANPVLQSQSPDIVEVTPMHFDFVVMLLLPELVKQIRFCL